MTKATNPIRSQKVVRVLVVAAVAFSLLQLIYSLWLRGILMSQLNTNVLADAVVLGVHGYTLSALLINAMYITASSIVAYLILSFYKVPRGALIAVLAGVQLFISSLFMGGYGLPFVYFVGFGGPFLFAFTMFFGGHALFNSWKIHLVYKLAIGGLLPILSVLLIVVPHLLGLDFLIQYFY